MKPVAFPEQTVVMAKDQPEYLPLPAHRDAEGLVTTCWKLTFKERLIVLFLGKFWFQQHTFGMRLQPQRPSVEMPELGPTAEKETLKQ